MSGAWVTEVIGASPVAALTTWITRHRLRVVAFHGVADRRRFADQLDFICSRFQVVDEVTLTAHWSTGRDLPERSVWITFDDGDRSVIEHGLPELERRGIPATMFLCPGIVESGSAPWWETVGRAGALGHGRTVAGQRLSGDDLVRALKTVPDSQRRLHVDALSAAIPPDTRPRTTPADLERWVATGRALGNHTWDHPCLDMCSPDEQERQIHMADRWLRERFGAVASFAYPNGDWAAPAERAALERGYELIALFDHRLADLKCPPTSISRVRLDAGADVSRTRAVLSGAHTAAFHAGRWLKTTAQRRMTSPKRDLQRKDAM